MSRVVSPEDSACFIPGRYSRSYWINSNYLMMYKLICSLCLSAFIAAGFSGCGGEAPAPKKEEKKAAAPAAPTGGKEAAKEAPKK